MIDQRQYTRIMVENVWLETPKERFYVVDISQKALRVLGTADTIKENEFIPATLCLSDSTQVYFESLKCQLLRYDKTYTVFEFEPPRNDWLDFVNKFRAIRSDELDSHLFD